MSVFISICFLLQVLTEGFGQVYSGLVGQTDKDPQYICHFIGKVVFLSLLERLISVFARHHLPPGQTKQESGGVRLGQYQGNRRKKKDRPAENIQKRQPHQASLTGRDCSRGR